MAHLTTTTSKQRPRFHTCRTAEKLHISTKIGFSKLSLVSQLAGTWIFGRRLLSKFYQHPM
jgi:hypothetical protein